MNLNSIEVGSPFNLLNPKVGTFYLFCIYEVPNFAKI